MRNLTLGITVLLVGALIVAGCCSSSSSGSSKSTGASSASAPIERFSPAAEAANGKIYLIGGMDASGSSLTVVEEYEPTNGTWTTKKSMPTARSGAETAVWNGEIYVIGGRAGNTVMNTVERYTAATDTWTTMPSMPTARWYPMVEAVDGKIYVVGGIAGTGDARRTLSAFEVFSVSDNTWTKLPDAPFSRQNGATAAIGSDLYVISGRGGTGEGASTVALVNKYSSTASRWTTVSSLPTARTGVRGGATENGKIAVAGGAAEEKTIPAVLVYSPQTDRWEQQGSLQSPRSGQSCVVIGNTLYVLSGSTTNDMSGVTTKVESFKIT